MALSKKNRIKKQSEFTKIFKSGGRIGSAFLSVVFDTAPGLVTKIAVVVPSKVSPKATRRNRIKRILTTEVNRFFETKPTPVKLVVVVKKDGSDLELIKNLKDLVGQIKQK